MAPRPRYVPVTMFQKANLLKTLLLKVVDLLFNLREVTGAQFFFRSTRVEYLFEFLSRGFGNAGAGNAHQFPLSSFYVEPVT